MILQRFLTLLILSLLVGESLASPAYCLFNRNNRTYAADSTGSEIIWADYFETNTLSDWQVYDENVKNESSDWHIEKGFLVQTLKIGNSVELKGTQIVSGNMNWENYIVKANLVYTDDDYAGLLFRYRDENNFYRFIFSYKLKTIRLDKKVSGKIHEIKILENQPLDTCKFTVVVSVKNDSIKIFFNEKLTIEAKDDGIKNGKVGFTSLGSLSLFCDDIIVYRNYKVEKSYNDKAIIRGPYIQSVLEDSAVIRWNTNFSCISKVEYGLKPEAQFSVVVPNLINTHEVMLNNLSSGTKYYYRVFYENKSTEWYSFKTPHVNDIPFNMIIYGDNQLNFLRHREIISRFYKRDFDFIINCGDVVQRGLRRDWDTEFFEPLSSVISQKPLYSVPGNHELNSKYFYQNFSYPDAQHENYYTFKYSNCYFIFIDNPLAAYPDKIEYTDYKKGSSQYKWLEEQLSSKQAQNAEWLFVISHVPISIPGKPSAYPGCEEYLLPLIKKYGVDFSFSGHLHGYKRGEEDGINYVITAGGGGVLFKKKNDMQISKKDFLRDYNYCYLSVEGKKITFKTYDKNDKLIDEEVFKK